LKGGSTLITLAQSLRKGQLAALFRGLVQGMMHIVKENPAIQLHLGDKDGSQGGKRQGNGHN
jgi:hypothetical protein